MKIIRFLDDNDEVHIGEPVDDTYTQAEVLAGDLYARLEHTGMALPIKKLLMPVVPANVYCVGIHYWKPYEEGAVKRGDPLPTRPMIFMKPTTTLAHPHGDVFVPALEEGGQLDYEGELVIVIGKLARDVKAVDALQYVRGWTVANDIRQWADNNMTAESHRSPRHWQRQAGVPFGGQINIGKGFDTHCPIGPALVTTDEIADPNAGDGLRLTTTLDGKLMKDTQTKDLISILTTDRISSCAKIIEWLSADRTLLPGTVILIGTPTGTPACAFAHKSSRKAWMKAGGTVCVEIEGIGKLCNTIVTTPAEGAAELVQSNVLAHITTAGSRAPPSSDFLSVAILMVAACGLYVCRQWFKRKTN